MVSDEALLITERQNAQTVTELSIMQLVVGSILDKKAGKALEKRLKKLSIQVVPRSIGADLEKVEWRPTAAQIDNGWVPPEVEE